jgi:hypothetical protein
MLLALALYASTSHAGVPAGFGGTPGIVNERTRRTATSSCCTTTGRPIGRTDASSFGSLCLLAAAYTRLAPRART